MNIKLLTIELFFALSKAHEKTPLAGYGVLRHLQQYFSYIVAISFIGEGAPGEIHRPAVSH